MSESPNTCPDCGNKLPSGSPGELCPTCLMAQALASRTVVEDAQTTYPPPPSPEEIGDRFPGFEILECLGRGGMGVVYKARQKSLNRLVAIKLLAPGRAGEPRFAERFAREAELLAKLNHPHIVTIHDFGETGGLFFLVMEFIDGVNLRDLLRDGKLEPEQALAIVPPICEALQYAHGKGIVHRDIKPENLLLDRDGRIKIADFGVASLIGASGESTGTPPYIAPEQLAAASKVDSRADIYALGAVLYEMLTGERPDKEIAAPSKKVEIDARLDEMVLRALEKNPELRYQTAEDFRTAVETMQAAPSAAKPPAIPASPPPRGMLKRWWWMFLVMIPVAIAAGLAAGVFLSSVIPRKFEAITTLELVSAEMRATPRFFETQFEVLTSRQALTEVSKRMDLQRRWMLQPGQEIPLLKEIIRTQNIRGTDLVEIRVRHSDAQEAAEIANTLTQVYRETTGGAAVIIEAAMVPAIAVTPNQRISPILGGGLGLVASPLIALLLMAALQRVFPERKDASRPAVKQKHPIAGKWALGLLLLGVMAGTTLWDSIDERLLIVTVGVVTLGAMALGIRSWESRAGKVAALTSGLWMIGWLILTLGFFGQGSLHRHTKEMLYPHLEIPKDHHGVLVMVHGQPGHPELPIRGKHQVLRFPEDGVLITSSMPRFSVGATLKLQTYDPATGRIWGGSEIACHFNTWETGSFADGRKFHFHVFEVGDNLYWQARRTGEPAHPVLQARRRLQEASERKKLEALEPMALLEKATFDPEIGLTLHEFEEETGNHALSFSKGTLVPLDSSQLDQAEPDLPDLLVSFTGGHCKWLVNQMRFGDLRADEWENATRERIDKALAAGTKQLEPLGNKGPWTRLQWNHEDTDLPAVLAFQTASGERGLLRVEGFTSEPYGIKMRYKLLQRSN